jgi:chromosome segregation ATPase
VSDDRAGDLLELARELELRDADVAARLDVVLGSLRQVDEVRAGAARVRASLAAIPGEIEHLEQAERDAKAREADLRDELSDAERRLEEVRRSRRAGEDAKVAAERAVRRAAVAASDAATAVERIRERLRAVAAEELALRAEGEGLVVEARRVASVVAAVPRLSDSGRAVPGRSLEEIEEWGARAHAGLFVVRGGLENEREQIVLEANTLAAAALGEQPAGSNVSLVRKRLEGSLS